MGISTPGIGSNLDVNGIVSKLMQAEAAPLTALAKKEASYQAKLSAFGTLSGTLSAFKDALTKLNTPATFQSMKASVADSTIFGATATAKASAGSYSINVSKLAQAQTLSSTGLSSTTTSVGTGTLVFKFGTSSIIDAGNVLDTGIAASGIAAGSLSINGTTISTGSSTNSAKALAAQINLASATTGVTATAKTDTGVLGAFADASSGPYKLIVGGVTILDAASNGPIDGSQIDTQLGDPAILNSLTAAGISFSGNAFAGTLKFTRTDGSNLSIQQTGTGGFAGIDAIGKTFTGSVSLSSDKAITVAGSDPTIAGFTTGTVRTASFTQNANSASGQVTIDSTNNSLQGIRDAINKANLGVTATIVSDGSASPYHLVIKSNTTGAASSMKIDVQNGDAQGGLASLLAYDPTGTQNMTQTTAAQSAALTVNGIAVTSETNSISGAIEGVSLDLAKTGSSDLTVKLDSTGVQAAVNGLVKTYNDLYSTIKKVSGYSSDTKEAGILIGDSSVRSIDMQIRKMLSSAATGSNSSLTTLSQIGISIDKTGTMSLDSSKLTSAMSKNIDDVTALFSSMGKATDSLVGFDSATTVTKPGTYDVVVTQLATQGKVTGNKDLRTGAINVTGGAGGNDDLSLTIDGISASLSLTAGAYSATQFAAQLQSAINGTSAFSKEGISVSVTIDGSGFLNITSNRYGSASKVDISSSNNGVIDLFGALNTSLATGQDVAGSIGGVAATGSGQFLTGAGSSPADGLKLKITGGAAIAGGASRGTVTFSQGYAFHLNNLVDGYLGTKGLLAGRTDGIKASIKDIEKQTDRMNDKLTTMEARYRKQFAALDALIGTMNSTSSYLSQQLQQISNLSKG